MPVFSEAVPTLIKAQKSSPSVFSFPLFPSLWNRKNKHHRSAVLLLQVVFLCFLFSPAHALAQMTSIKEDKVNMRAKPSTTSPILWELGEGFPLVVLKKKKYWLKVKDFEGDVGWVYRKLTSNRPHLIVKKDLVNIRKKPTSGSMLVGKAKYGVVFATLKQYKGWVKVKHQSGLTGWIRRDLLWGW